MELAENLRSLKNADDIEEIRQVVAAYCQFVDKALQAGGTPDVTCLFHPNAEFSTSFQREVRAWP